MSAGRFTARWPWYTAPATGRIHTLLYKDVGAQYEGGASPMGGAPLARVLARRESRPPPQRMTKASTASTPNIPAANTPIRFRSPST